MTVTPKIFDVPGGLPESYSLKPPETGADVVAWKQDNRRIFNCLYGLNPTTDPSVVIEIDKWGQESFAPDHEILLPGQIGFMVISKYIPLNKLGADEPILDRLDIGAAYTPSSRGLNIVFAPDSKGTCFEMWGFLFNIAERLI